MFDDPILEKALHERQRCIAEAQKWQTEAKGWEDFIARYSKMKGVKAPEAQLDLPISPAKALREKPKGREMGEPRKSITEWMKRTIAEEGSASYEEVCKAFPNIDPVQISKILDRNRKYGFIYDKATKKWTYKGD